MQGSCNRWVPISSQSAAVDLPLCRLVWHALMAPICRTRTRWAQSGLFFGSVCAMSRTQTIRQFGMDVTSVPMQFTQHVLPPQHLFFDGHDTQVDPESGWNREMSRVSYSKVPSVGLSSHGRLGYTNNHCTG